MMLRKAFVMTVYPQYYEEYEKRHAELWPAMEEAIKAHGAHSYSIFLHPATGQLFAYLEINDEQLWDALASTEICRQWWAYMAPLMETHANNQPVSIDLKQVFHLS